MERGCKTLVEACVRPRRAEGNAEMETKTFRYQKMSKKKTSKQKFPFCLKISLYSHLSYLSLNYGGCLYLPSEYKDDVRICISATAKPKKPL